MLERIERNIWSNCSVVEGLFKEMRHKLTWEKCIICNGDIIAPLQTFRKDISVHEDAHCGLTATQRKLKLQARWLGYTKVEEDFIKRCPKCADIKIFNKPNFTDDPKSWIRVHKDQAYVRDFGLFLILCGLIFGMTGGNQRNKQKTSTVKQALRTIFSRIEEKR